MGLAGNQINNPINHCYDTRGIMPSVRTGKVYWDPVGAFVVVVLPLINIEILR